MRLPSSRTLVRSAAFIILVAAACLSYAYQDELKSTVRTILDSKWAVAGVSIYVICCAVMYQALVGGNSGIGGIFHSHFGKYADAVFAVVAFVPAGATSLTLLKGLFMQYFFGQIYFIGFGEIDMTSMLVVSSFLLYYSLYNATKMLVTAIAGVDSVKISTVSDTK